MEDQSLYTARFYAERSSGSARSAAAALGFVLARRRVTSVIDVGCGVGTWLAAARELGVATILGVVGGWVSPGSLSIPRETFRVHDLSLRFRGERRYDLVISTEVGEHLNPSCAGTFVDSLAGLGDAVLFSAAIPEQEGTGHVNERWPEYWSRLFSEHGFRPLDVLRPYLWNRDDVDYWYAQNLILYVKGDAQGWHGEVSSLPAFPCNPHPMALVHPRAFNLRTRALHDIRDHRAGFGVRWSLVELRAAARRALRRATGAR